MTSLEIFEIVKYRKLYDIQYTAFIRELIQINSEEKMWDVMSISERVNLRKSFQDK